jgi:ribosomal-protein-alanine N-acetyltransferase
MNKMLAIRIASSADFVDLKKILDNTHSDWSSVVLSTCFIPDYFIWIIGELNGVMGFVVVKDNIDCWEILQIVIDQPYQRHGHALKLLNFVIAKARLKQIQKLILEVRASNHAAISLYEKIGFTRVGIRKKYYSDGEDAVLMDCIV